VIQAEIATLEQYSSTKKPYHPIKENYFILALIEEQMYRENLNEVEKERKMLSDLEKSLPIFEMIAPDFDRMRLEKRYEEAVQNYEKYLNTIDTLVSPVMVFRRGFPEHFFYNVLKIVIFNLLHYDGNFPKEKAKGLAADIINKYIKGDSFPAKLIKDLKKRPKKLTSKDIDNVIIHS
jgi:hypothetical protein